MLRRLAVLSAIVSSGLAISAAALGADQSAPATPPAAQDAKSELAVPSAPRPAQIEPMVAPVKRVVPLTPVIKTEAGDKKAATSKDKLGKDTKRAERAKVVGDTPNCDTGFKVDPSGKSCVKIASSEQPAKKRKK